MLKLIQRGVSRTSSGSTVAVSTNLCAGAIGTDTSNSIVAVSMRNGVVGYKPPYHVLSQKGTIFFTYSTGEQLLKTALSMEAFVLKGYVSPPINSE